MLHGGGFESGSKEKYIEWGPYLGESGYVAMAINYRLATPSYPTWPGLMDDVRDAVNWIVKNASDRKNRAIKNGVNG